MHFNFLPSHVYAFRYDIVPFSTLVIVQLGYMRILDPSIAKDSFHNHAICVTI